MVAIFKKYVIHVKKKHFLPCVSFYFGVSRRFPTYFGASRRFSYSILALRAVFLPFSALRANFLNFRRFAPISYFFLLLPVFSYFSVGISAGKKNYTGSNKYSAPCANITVNLYHHSSSNQLTQCPVS